jgi:hypothetical protein
MSKGSEGACTPSGIPTFLLAAFTAQLPFAPALGRFVRPPGAMLTIAELHLHAMLATPAFWACLLAFRLLLCGKALEQRFQPRYRSSENELEIQDWLP